MGPAAVKAMAAGSLGATGTRPGAQEARKIGCFASVGSLWLHCVVRPTPHTGRAGSQTQPQASFATDSQLSSDEIPITQHTGALISMCIGIAATTKAD